MQEYLCKPSVHYGSDPGSAAERVELAGSLMDRMGHICVGVVCGWSATVSDALSGNCSLGVQERGPEGEGGWRGSEVGREEGVGEGYRTDQAHFSASISDSKRTGGSSSSSSRQGNRGRDGAICHSLASQETLDLILSVLTRSPLGAWMLSKHFKSSGYKVFTPHVDTDTDTSAHLYHKTCMCTH